MSSSKPRTFLVTGCGSIGRRHITNLLELRAGRVLAHDVSAARLHEVTSRFSVEGTNSWDEALAAAPDVVFVCNPTSFHVRTALDALRRDCHVFVEKPLSHNSDFLDQVSSEAESRQRVVLVGCNFRFQHGMRKMHELLQQQILGQIFSVSAEFGHYLPDWRPWQDYRESYSSHSELGGGVLLDAYHEFDYLFWLLGSVNSIFCKTTRSRSLQLDTEDLALVIVSFSNGALGQISLDYVRRPYRRHCQVIAEFGTIEWDFGQDTVRVFDTRDRTWTTYCGESKLDVNQMYLDELRHFLACLDGSETPIATLQDAINVQAIVLAAKQSAVTSAPVSLSALPLPVLL